MLVYWCNIVLVVKPRTAPQLFSHQTLQSGHLTVPHCGDPWPGSAVPHVRAGCCRAETRCAPAAPSCPPLPGEPADATESPAVLSPPAEGAAGGGVSIVPFHF